MSSAKNHYQAIARALPLLAGEARGCWALAARRAGMSPPHFQRVFKRHVGATPRQYAAMSALADVKSRLAAGEAVLHAALAAGLSGGGRAHDLFVAADATTPGEFARQGEGVAIRCGIASSPFGPVFVAATDRGVCLLHFIGAENVGGAKSTDGSADGMAIGMRKLRRRWPAADIRRDDSRAKALAHAVFAGGADAPLHARGTNFQINIWRALLALPVGAVVSYRALADAAASSPAHARAVAGAVAANPVAALIPCHRVLAADGRLAGYAWGENIKRALLAREFAVAARAAVRQ